MTFLGAWSSKEGVVVGFVGSFFMLEEKVMNKQMTLVAPACTCCEEPKPLVPRTDLPGQMAACPQSGALYRAEGTGYVPSTLPDLTGAYRPLPSVRIDLSQAGYA